MLAFTPIPTDVQDPFNPSGQGGGISSLPEIFAAAMNIILGIGWGLGILALVLGFTKYTLSKGDPKELQKAQAHIIYALVGIGILFLITAYKFIIARGITGGDFDIPGVSNITN